MTTRRLQFFMRPGELAPLLGEVARKRGLSVVLVRLGPNRRLELAARPDSPLMADGRAAEWLFLAAEQPDLARIDPAPLRPGEWGWMQVDLPSEEGNTLFLAEIAAKSDWYDADSGQILENPASLTLFRQLTPPLRKRLKRPVCAYNIR